MLEDNRKDLMFRYFKQTVYDATIMIRPGKSRLAMLDTISKARTYYDIDLCREAVIIGAKLQGRYPK